MLVKRVTCQYTTLTITTWSTGRCTYLIGRHTWTLIFSHSYCFFTGSGPDKVPEHSDFIWRSHSASSIEEFLSTGQSPPLSGSPFRSNSPFATPRAHGRAPA